MSIIIIGNGSTLLDKENGSKIDSFDIVVRFNAYAIKGYEKNAGTKTTYWFNTINFQNIAGESRTKIPYERIVIHSWEWDPTKDKTYQNFLKFYKDSVDLRKTSRDLIEEMRAYAPDSSYSAYSTGAMAIWMLLKEHSEVTITGFDWWSTDKHHYSDNAPRGTLHKPDKEFEFIDKLIKENKIKVL
jgi:hypothetical protein